MPVPTTIEERRFVTATAPIRLADLGGWTDTWFAGHGFVCNIAVRPGAEVRIAEAESALGQPAQIEPALRRLPPAEDAGRGRAAVGARGGTSWGGGPDEPLVECTRPVAWISDDVIAEAVAEVDAVTRTPDWGPLKRG